MMRDKDLLWEIVAVVLLVALIVFFSFNMGLAIGAKRSSAIMIEDESVTVNLNSLYAYKGKLVMPPNGLQITIEPKGE